MKKDSILYYLKSGGEGGVRTLAPLLRPNSLANCPLHHLGTSPYNEYKKTPFLIKKWRKR